MFELLGYCCVFFSVFLFLHLSKAFFYSFHLRLIVRVGCRVFIATSTSSLLGEHPQPLTDLSRTATKGESVAMGQKKGFHLAWRWTWAAGIHCWTLWRCRGPISRTPWKATWWPRGSSLTRPAHKGQHQWVGLKPEWKKIFVSVCVAREKTILCFAFDSETDIQQNCIIRTARLLHLNTRVVPRLLVLLALIWLHTCSVTWNHKTV